jgi:hypothetical protein
MSSAALYDKYYFQHGCGRPYERTVEWLRFFAGIADKIVGEIDPHTVLDAGCAMGFLVEALRDRGVEAFGVDVSEYALQQVRPDLRGYCWVGSVAEPLPRRYDLIVCIEVLEHLPKEVGERAIANFCQASEDVLFSSTPLDYREATHFNVQPPEYWSDQFAAQSFVRDVDFDASFVAPWAARFRRNNEPWRRVLRDYERRFWLLWKENQDLRSLNVEMRNQLAAAEQARQALEARVTEKENELAVGNLALQKLRAEYVDSPSGRLAQFLRRVSLSIAPSGSWRKRWLDEIMRRMVPAPRR